MLVDLDTNKVSTLFGNGYPAEDSGHDPGDTSWGNLDCTGSPHEFFLPTALAC